MKKEIPLKAERDDLPSDLQHLLDELENEFEDSPNEWNVISELRLCLDQPDFDNDLIQQMAEEFLKHEKARKAAAIHGLPSDLQRLLDQVEQESRSYPRRDSDIDELRTNIDFGDFDTAREVAEKIIKRQKPPKSKKKKSTRPVTNKPRSASQEELKKKEIEIAEAILPICQRLAKKYSSSQIRVFYEDELCGGQAPKLGKAFEAVADSVGPCFYPLYDSCLPEEIDRLRGCVGSAPYVSATFPWPQVGERYLVPWLQLDLDEIRDSTGVDVGEGLLQVWRQDQEHAHIRHIPRQSVDPAANLLPIPEALKSFGAIEGMFENGEFGGPWQCVGWKLAGLALPRDPLLLTGNHDGWDDCLSIDDPDPRFDDAGNPRFPLWDEEGEDESNFETLIKRGARLLRSREPEMERPLAEGHPDYSTTADCLFGFPDSEEDDSITDDGPQHCDLLGQHWRPLITISGPMDVELFTDRCTVYFRRLGDGFNYTAKCLMARSG